ncbi:MAG: SDR family NAD(P)-dependent oxidoreductase [Hyphomicrobiales bacterium]|nr:SDR family NAD(P)-dependent oxidoreductase [Hyphomicrobiales bacterium]
MDRLAVVTGASTGIGFELARCAAEKGYDLVIAADEPEIETAAEQLRSSGAVVVAVEVDLSTGEGVDKLYDAIKACGRPVDALLANAGRGLGTAFLDQEREAWKKVIDTNVSGALDIIHKVGRDMRARNEGRILITGSIAGFTPGAFQAVYNASKAFLDSFSFALRNELKETHVTVTCLMPGATETDFFERAGLMDTKIGTSKKDDAGDVARQGFEAMLKGEGDVVTGWHNKLQSAIANITPSAMLAERHRKQAAPGTAAH